MKEIILTAVFFMALSEKAKMLGFALHTRKVTKQTTLKIIMLLDLDDELEDMMWFMGQNPSASEKMLLAVAMQLDKESREKGLK